MAAPRLSILIPNYNNGRAASRSGERDFLADLLRSLLETLHDDPTPLEILIADDGSTDDSLATARTWSEFTWSSAAQALGLPGARGRGDTPFCRLLELEHTGVLSVVANRLTTMARGQVVCRLDGDIVIHTPRWAHALVRQFEEGPPDLGIVGGQQLGLDGRIHSAGCCVLHPRGHHHLGQGAPAGSIPFTLDVDHVMGCFYAHRRGVWETLGGYDESMRRGQTVDFGLRARRAGWSAICVPTIVFTHAHEDRVARPTQADTTAGIDESRARFRAVWGFDRLAPDLDAVYRQYAGTPLVGNAAVFGPRRPARWTTTPPGPITAWGRYAADATYRTVVDQRVALAIETADVAPAARLLVPACREGLLCHLLARAGFAVTGVDEDPLRIACGQAFCARSETPAAVTLIEQEASETWPVEDDAFDAVLLLDVLDTHPNPIRVLAEAHRVAVPDGRLVVLVRERAVQDVVDGATHPYRRHELLLQLEHSGLFQPELIPRDKTPRGMIAATGRPKAANLYGAPSPSWMVAAGP